MSTTVLIIIVTIVIVVAIFVNYCSTWNNMLRLHNEQKEIIEELIKTIRDLDKKGFRITKGE